MRRRPLEDRPLVEQAGRKYGFCFIDGEGDQVMVIYEAMRLARKHERAKEAKEK